MAGFDLVSAAEGGHEVDFTCTLMETVVFLSFGKGPGKENIGTFLSEPCDVVNSSDGTSSTGFFKLSGTRPSLSS